MTTDTNTRTIARTILAQLGGNRFLAMTGAKNLVDTGKGLTMKLPARATKKGINFVGIKLTPADLYDVTFSKVRGYEAATVASAKGVTYDQLQAIFTEETGLLTRL